MGGISGPGKGRAVVWLAQVLSGNCPRTKHLKLEVWVCFAKSAVAKDITKRLRKGRGINKPQRLCAQLYRPAVW